MSDYIPTTDQVLYAAVATGYYRYDEVDRWHQAELRKARVEALREAADYAAAGVHCADMGVAPLSMIRWLRARADRIQEDQ